MAGNKKIEHGLVQVQVVNYMNWESTVSCIQSLHKQTYHRYRLLVIENASPNDSLERLREFDPHLSITVSKSNVGWGAGLNLGFFRHTFETNPEFYFTVNSDVTLEPDCLSKLVKEMRLSPRCAVMAPIIYENPTSNKTNNTGFNLSYKYLVPLDFFWLLGFRKNCPTKKLRKVNWVSDTAALMRGSAVCKIGGYDEKYFMYGQMTDMGYRLKQHGYELIVNCIAEAYHTGKGSSGGKLSEFSLYHKLKNWCIFHRKHFGEHHIPYTVTWCSAVFLFYGFKVVLQKDPSLIKAIIKGIRDGLTYDFKAAQDIRVDCNMAGTAR